MKKIPFDISYKQDIIDCKLGIKVVTRNDRPVKIISWDATENRPIAAVIDNDAFLYRKDGFWDDTITDDMDLFILFPFKPKFKVGNRIKSISGSSNKTFKIEKIVDGFYWEGNKSFLSISDDDQFELATSEFETTLGRLLKEYGFSDNSGDVYKFASEVSETLLEIAKNEILRTNSQ